MAAAEKAAAEMAAAEKGLVRPLGGLELTTLQLRLFERLFAGCSRVDVK